MALAIRTFFFLLFLSYVAADSESEFDAKIEAWKRAAVVGGRQNEYVRVSVDTLRAMLERQVIDGSNRSVEPYRAGPPDILVCQTCAAAITAIVPEVKKPKVYAKLVDVAIWLCIALEWFPERICRGAVETWNPTLYHTILHWMEVGPNSFCSKLTGRNCMLRPKDNDDPLGKAWSVNLPPISPNFTNTRKPSQGKVLNILHISDIHADPLYSENSPAHCTEPLCCRYDVTAKPGDTERAGPIGGYYCEPSVPVVQQFLNQIASRHQIDAVYITGDMGPHDVWSQTRPQHLSIIATVNRMLKKAFKSAPVLIALGNHEALPCNQFPTMEQSGGEFNTNWLYDYVAEEWIDRHKWLGEAARSSIQTSGSFSTLIQPGFRVIVINDNHCQEDNWWLYRNATDPAGLLQWLVDELAMAEDNNERVHMVMHIVPGNSCYNQWSWNYYKIVDRFRNVIDYQFAGHSHDLYYQIFYDNVNFTEPVSVVHVGPSVTPYTEENPGYRLVKVDADSLEMLDYDVYYYNLTEANRVNRMEFSKLYSAKEAYGLPDMSPQSWHDLATRFQDDDELFQQYYHWLDRLAGFTLPNCTDTCKRKELCGIHTTRASDEGKICNKFFPTKLS